MKNLILVIICAFLSNLTFAQVIENQVPMSQGNKNSFMIELADQQAKDIEKAWTKYLKKFDGKTKKDKKSGEYLSDNAEIKNMSDNTVDIYSKVIQRGTNCQLIVWFDLGGAFLNSRTHPDAFAAAKELLYEFDLSTKITATKDDLKQEESRLKKLNKELKGLEKDKKGYENDIEKYQKRIAEAKQKIKENIAKQESKNGEIKRQDGKVKEVQTKLKKLEKGKS